MVQDRIAFNDLKQIIESHWPVHLPTSTNAAQ